MSYEHPDKSTGRLLASLIMFRFWSVIGTAEIINGKCKLVSRLKQKIQYDLRVVRHGKNLLCVKRQAELREEPLLWKTLVQNEKKLKYNGE